MIYLILNMFSIGMQIKNNYNILHIKYDMNIINIKKITFIHRYICNNLYIIQILGIDLCLSRVNNLIKDALGKADLNNNIKLKGLVGIHL